MWMVATKKHEAFKASIFSALQFIVMRGMKPKELNFLYEKLRGMPLREHDKFSLNLLKTIAKGLAPPLAQRKPKTDYSKVQIPLVSSLKRRGSAEFGGSDGGGKNRGRRGGLLNDNLNLRIDTQNLATNN